MNKLSKIFVYVLSVTGVSFLMIEKVHAQSFLPQQIIDIFRLLGVEGTGTAAFITSRVQTALFIALGAVILIAVVYALIAAFKYIQSQGDPGKIEEAQKAIKAIFLGVAAMMIAIVGIVLVFVFFGANAVEPALFQTCLSAPGSLGCADCSTNGNLIRPTPGVPITWGPTSGPGSTCANCESAYAAIAASGNSGDISSLPSTCVDPISN